MPTISVIVPVYKVEPYLRECIESILNQTFRDFELILVDDGSPDNCGKICDEYALKDSRIVVIHKENGGSSSARNAGIIKSSGNYITFIDGDDIVDSNLFDCYIDGFGLPSVDCVRISYQSTIDFLTFRQHHIGVSDQVCYFKTDERKENFLTENVRKYYFGHEVCFACYKRTIILENAIYFPDGFNYAEDLFFTLCYTICSNSVMFCNKPLYTYRVHDGSCMQTVGQKDMLSELNELSQHARIYLKNKNLTHFFVLFHGIFIEQEIRKYVSLNNKGVIKDLKKATNRIKNKKYFVHNNRIFYSLYSQPKKWMAEKILEKYICSLNPLILYLYYIVFHIFRQKTGNKKT